MAGQASLHLLPGQVTSGTQITLSHAELVHVTGDIFDWYCQPNLEAEGFRKEPCKPHQTFGYGHEISDRYQGDFNDVGVDFRFCGFFSAFGFCFSA